MRIYLYQAGSKFDFYFGGRRGCMVPTHDNFYDTYSKAKKIKIKWPNGARMAIGLAGKREGRTENPSAETRRPHHVGGSNPNKESEGLSQYRFRTASEND